MTRIEIVEAMDGKPLRLAASIMVEIWNTKTWANIQSQFVKPKYLEDHPSLVNG